MSADEYPTLGFDPAPGKPASVNDLATKLSTAVGGLEKASSTLTGIAKGGEEKSVWEGEAATAFSKRVGELPHYLKDSHDALKSAATQLTTWHTKLVGYQATARKYEAEAKTAKSHEATAQKSHDHKASAYNEAGADPAFGLVGRAYGTQAEAHAAQAKIDAASARVKRAGHALDTATKQLNAARDELEAIVQKAKDLLDHHQAEARSIAAKLRKADAKAPNPSFWEGVGDGFKKLGHGIKDWCTKHADLLKTVGDWMSTASGILGVAALATMWCPPLAGGLALAGGIAAGGALAAHGAAKLGGADVGWTKLAFDGVGVVPAGGFGKDLVAGVKVSVKAAKAGDAANKLALKGVNTISKLKSAGFELTKDTENEAKLAAGNKYEFTRDNLGIKGKLSLAWHHNVVKFSEGTLLADGVSKIFTAEQMPKLPGIVSAMRPDGTLDPMSWWSRGVQISKGLGLPGKLQEDFSSGAPAASSLG
ncbi:putative T7SS-secreted protein [Streptomyces montanisoli]|uniref:Putative T7SS secretion signal domain-containing protein n=1 Tax=Streptomyces montanisoli TaxID=2798581 RepID=A0A940MES0_9ACTN|nr:hypothetical protein [Streptomyces montanisoli]MBP0458675.1 hypothetical protein [Streptomyces montanisoli]